LSFFVKKITNKPINVPAAVGIKGRKVYFISIKDFIDK